MNIEQVENPDQVAAVRELFREYLSWVSTVETCSHRHPTFIGIEEEVAQLPAMYAPPDGRLLLATVNGYPAGCVAIKPHGRPECELKRMYVRPEFRANGIGRALVEAAVREAKAAGYTRVVLDSHITMKGAHRLYQSVGFEWADVPDSFPVEYRPVVVFMKLDLAEEAVGRS